MSKKVIAKNKRAPYDYQLLEKFEAGIELKGTEVKSIRLGKVSIIESHVTVDDSYTAWIHNMNVAHYLFGNINNHQETRKRKLLLNKRELIHIYSKVRSSNLTIVATCIYFKKNFVKLEIAIARSKKKYDKRQDQIKKEINRKLSYKNYD